MRETVIVAKIISVRAKHYHMIRLRKINEAYYVMCLCPTPNDQ